MFKKIFNANSIPVAFIAIGLFSLLLSIWGTFENPLWKETWNTIGKTILASGVFAGILKLMQISGVFKEELEKLIFEPRFLQNRKDIPNYWEKISQELFKNKFPNISRKLLSDIKNTYLPTTEMVYYDESEHFIEISLDIDDVLVIRQKTTLTIVCTGDNDCFSYEFSNSLDFIESPDETSYVCSYIRVNGSKVEHFKHTRNVDNKTVTNKFRVELEGASKYEIEREETRKYRLNVNDVLYFRAARLTNTLTVGVNHSPNVIIAFRKMGVLGSFTEKQTSATYKRYEYKNMIYKEQGYIIQLKKSNHETTSPHP